MTNEAKKVNNGITEMVFIIDKSGSMAGLEADTIGGFNGMIEKQKREKEQENSGYKPCEKPGQEYIYTAKNTVIERVKELFADIPVGRAVCAGYFSYGSDFRGAG